MRKKRVEKFVLLVFIVYFISGCGTPPKVQQANLLINQGKKVEALELYETAFSELSSRKKERFKIEPTIGNLRKEITDDALSKAEKAYGLKASVQGIKDAIVILEEYLSCDDGYRIQKRLSQCESFLEELRNIYRSKLEESAADASRGSWTSAYKLITEAAEIFPNNPETEKIKRSIVKDRNEFYRENTEKFLSKNDWKEAQKLIMSLRAEIPKPKNSLISELGEKLIKRKNGVVVKDAIILIGQGKYFTAYNMIKDAGFLSSEEHKEFIDSISKEGAEYYVDLIKKEIVTPRGNHSCAYLAAVKATILDPENAEAFNLHRDLEDKIDQQIKTRIAISGFESPKEDSQVGTQFADSLIAYLVNHLPYGIEILERSKIDIMLKESGQQLKELSKELGVKMFIIGNVSTLDVEHQRSENVATEIIIIGTRQVKNQEYNQMLATYGGNLKWWPSHPPPTISVNKTATVKYKIGKERVKGLINVSVRIFDAEKGAITVAKVFKASEEASDKFQDPVKAANIAYDPLELPTNNEIKEKLMDKVVSDVAHVVLQAFKQREEGFWERANARIKRHEWQKAKTELAKGYLYCKHEGISKDNEWCKKIHQAALFDLTEGEEMAFDLTEGTARN